MTETPERHFERLHPAYHSGAVVMAFYAGVAMPDEGQATHLPAVVEVVEVSVGIPFRGGQAMNGIHDVRGECIGKDAEILSIGGRQVLPPGAYR